MARSLALILCMLLAGVIAWAASQTPSPAPDRPGQFSGQRAFADVQAIAARPHPLGSADHDRVRDYILDRFTRMGLQVRVQGGHAFERSVYGGETYFEGGDVQNIVAVLPGAARTAPVVAVMAHYDTVPSSPGAADDTVGVAAALEIARVLKLATARERDVVFVITDGEEAGLLGARSFFADDPLASRIGAVLNMESRGGGGRAYMFETGPGDGSMIGLFTRSAANPTASSMAGYVYAHMSNDTDFTIARKRGLAGFNYAFIGRPFDYHAASSTPAALDQGSLQHIGQQVLAAARALSQAPALPEKRPDLVYSDLLGGPMIAYPAWGGWIVLALAAAVAGLSLRKAFRTEPFSLLDAVRGAAGLLLMAIVAAVLLAGARFATGVPFGFVEEKALLARFDLYEAALALVCFGSAVLVFAAAGIGRTRFWSAFSGALALGLVLGVALQAAAPLVAFMLGWPLLVAAGITAALAYRWGGAWDRPSSAIFTALVGALVLAQLLYVAHAVVLGVGAELPEVLAAFLLMAVLPLFPLLWPSQTGRLQPAIGALAIIVAAGLILFVRGAQPWSPRHPQPTDVVYAADLDKGRFWRASVMPKLDAWTRSALPDNEGPIRPRALPPIAEQAQAAPAWPVVVAKPTFWVAHPNAQRIAAKLAATSPVRQLRLDIRSTGRLTAGAVNGLSADLTTKPGQWVHIIWNAPADGLMLSFDRREAGQVDFRYGVVFNGWPSDAERLPPRSASVMPWMNSDTTVLIGSKPAPG